MSTSSYSLKADLPSVYKRLSERAARLRGLENLHRMLHGEPALPLPKHEYVREHGSGIGLCEVCLSDDIHDGNHIVQ